MCGLVGVFACSSFGFSQNEKKVFTELMYINALRGTDGSGIFYRTNKGDVQVYKEASLSSDFIKTKEFEDAMVELWHKGSFAVGHCRAATRGSKNDDNCHPFIVDDKIILSHNGTFYGDHQKHAKTEVDSHAIAHVLAEEEDITEALKKINAAYALVWYNVETEKLHLIRNTDRPLCIAEMKNGGYIFASEMAFIYTAAWRNSIQLKEGTDLLIPAYTLVTIDKEGDLTTEKLDCEFKYTQTPSYAGNITPFVPGAATGKIITGNFPPRKRRSIMEVAEETDIGRFNPKDLDWRTLFKEGEDIVIEVVDWQKAAQNDDRDPGYYVIGQIITHCPLIKGTLYAYWNVDAADDDALAHYIYGEDTDAEFSSYWVGKFHFAVGTKPKEQFRWIARLQDVQPVTEIDVKRLQ